MAPTPNVNTHLLQIKYVISGMTHKLQFHCQATEADGFFYLIDPLGGENTLWTYWLGQVTTALEGALPVGTTSAGASLFEWVDGQLVLRDSSTWTCTPGAATVILANGMVATWRDVDNKLVRITLLETGFGGPVKYTNAGDIPAGGMHDFIEAMDNHDAGEIGRYWLSRAGNHAHAFISCISDTNEKLRRIRGLK